MLTRLAYTGAALVALAFGGIGSAEAQQRAEVRRRLPRRPGKLSDPRVREYVERGLEQCWWKETPRKQVCSLPPGLAAPMWSLP